MRRFSKHLKIYKDFKEKKLLLNTSSSLVFQLITLISGFVLPHLILEFYGSNVNGVVNSLTQFLGLISLLELGVGAVVQSSLYKPLAENDHRKISEIIVSANKFFKKIALILAIYVFTLIFLYPFINNGKFDFMYTTILIISLSISSFSQYYFGIVNRLLLIADQKGYICYNIQSATLIMNTIFCCILIKCGASIHAVKLGTSLVFLIRPLYLYFYVKKHYHIDYDIKYKGEPIKQKWNGMAQHLSAVILDSTDTIVLTLFSSLSNVSIYSVYNMVVMGVKQLLISSTNGIQSVFGELWAKQELQKLKNQFQMVEWTIHTGSVFIFGCTGLLILPFIEIYTQGINDINYIQPIFAIIITLANSMHCLRLPYNLMILAGGHYKQTQRIYILVAIINIVVSITAVKSFGLVGVAIGTFIAMSFHTICLAYYISINLIEWPFKNFIKQICIDIVTIICMYISTKWITLENISYIAWVYMAIKICIIAIIIIAIVNLVFYKNNVKKVINRRIK